MLSGVPSYRSTLDRLTYTKVELRSVLWNLEAKFLERLLKLGYTCKAINAQTYRIHLKEKICVRVLCLR